MGMDDDAERIASTLRQDQAAAAAAGRELLAAQQAAHDFRAQCAREFRDAAKKAKISPRLWEVSVPTMWYLGDLTSKRYRVKRNGELRLRLPRFGNGDDWVRVPRPKSPEPHPPAPDDAVRAAFVHRLAELKAGGR